MWMIVSRIVLKKLRIAKFSFKKKINKGYNNIFANLQTVNMSTCVLLGNSVKI